MKNIKIIILLTALSNAVHAQDSLVHIKAIYVGLLSGAKFNTDTFHVSKFANVHLGGWASLDLGKTISLESWAAFHAETDDKPYALNAFWMNWSPSEEFKISFGNLTTPVTEFRPFVVSADGQFETWTEALLPGVATGTKASYTYKNFEAKLGAFYRNGNVAELSGKIKIGNLGVGGYGRDNHQYGGCINFDHKYFYTILSVTESGVGNFLSIKIKKFSLYSDSGFNRKNGRLVRGEWGVIRNFKLKSYGGVIAIGFQNETHTVNTYLFVHL